MMRSILSRCRLNIGTRSFSKNIVGIIWEGNTLASVKEGKMEEVEEHRDKKDCATGIPGMDSPHSRYRNKLAGKNVFLLNFLNDKYRGDGKNLAIAKSIGEKYDADKSLTHTAAQKILAYSAKRRLMSVVANDKGLPGMEEHLRAICSGIENVRTKPSDSDFVAMVESLDLEMFGHAQPFNILVVSSEYEHIRKCKSLGFLTCQYQ